MGSKMETGTPMTLVVVEHLRGLFNGCGVGTVAEECLRLVQGRRSGALLDLLGGEADRGR
jgi:hypothetical protein